MTKKFDHLKAALRGGRADRHTLLAFALVRGMAYRRVELTTRADNAPSRAYLAELAEVSPELVAAWLETPATPELLARAATARDAFLASKRARGALLRRSRGIEAPMPAPFV